MFCTNCGSKLPDGSNFCSVCGARLVAPEAANTETQATQTTSLWDEKVADFAPEVESRTPTVSFDWSNVKEESHKKVVTGVHSPWGTTGLTDKEIFDAVENAPSEDRSRTMSFIDILKQERDAKAQAANEEAKAVTERQEEPLDYSAFEETTSFYVPPLYDIEESIQNEEIRENEPVVEKHVADESSVSFETAEFERATVAGEPSKDLAQDLQSELADILSAGSGNKTERNDDTLVENSYLSMDDTDDEEELVEETQPKHFSIEDFFSDMTDLDSDKEEKSEVEPSKEFDLKPEEVVESSNPIFEPVVESDDFNQDVDVNGYLGIDDIEDTFEPVEVEEPTVDNIVFEPIVEEEEEETETEETFEEPKKVEVAPEYEDEESEIEALKKRLAELMGTSEESIEEATETKEIEETVETTEEPEEAAVDASPSVEEPFQEVELDVIADDQEEIGISLDEEPESLETEIEEIIAQEPELEEPVAIEEYEEDEEDFEDSDAISLDDLEKDLFGEISDENIEAEATKKIDKFYTLYKKNEEFQKLLDEEYNKLKAEDAVPHVDDFVTETPVMEEPEEEPNQTTIADSPRQEEKTAPIVELVSTEVPRVDNPKPIISKVAKKVKSEKKADNAATGSKLTVVAVIVAALLVVVLGIILILFCAPDSAIAWKIDSFLETITSYFSAVDVAKDQLLL